MRAAYSLASGIGGDDPATYQGRQTSSIGALEGAIPSGF